jgi:proteasome activator subunit 4
VCSIDKIAAQDAILKAQLPIIRLFMSCWILDDRLTSLFIDQLEKVIQSKSWHSRMGAIQMCQSFGIFNLFRVSATIRSRIQKIITDSLCDEQLEVRLSATIALTGFIHSNFIQVNDELLVTFKALSAVKARRKDKETGKFTINMANLVRRHGGILGMCAIVASCPYDVPEYLPEAATYLCQFVNDPVPIQVIKDRFVIFFVKAN